MQLNKINILHVFAQMNQGGAETGVMQALRRIDANKFHFDFLVTKKDTGQFDDEILSFGSKILYWDKFRSPIKSPKNFRQILRNQEFYPIIHSRLHHFSGYVLWLAYKNHIPVRIAHSHSDISNVKDNSNIYRKFYYKLSRYLIHKYATLGLAVSNSAAQSLFGRNWQNDPKYKVVYTGIDLNPFKEKNSKITRASLNISREAFVIGHVGSFREPKNHSFLLDVFKEVSLKEEKAFLILCGDGPLKNEMQKKVNELGLTSKVKFLGHFKYIAQIMKNVFDIFVLPSKREGLPHVAIEAQAAGLPSLFSQNITREIELIKELTFFLPIDQGISTWVKKILSIKKNKPLKIPNAYQKIEGTAFDVKVGVQNLFHIYEKEFNKIKG